MIKLLDCTLRDGGYINNWQFGEYAIKSTLKKLVNSNIDIIECGFLKSDISYNKDISLFSSINQIGKMCPITPSTPYYTAMINVGEFDFTLLPNANKSPISGIRIVFHRHEIALALELANGIKSKGYDVFIQPMATSTYTDKDLITLIEAVNDIEPFAFYIVDTFGAMYPGDLLRMFYLVDNNLSADIQIGFHSHNNLQLSFSNAQELMKLHTRRNIIIDSSIFGMGRGAGNLCTELIAQYINDNIGQKYDIVPLLEVIDEHLSVIRMEHSWGYSAPYYLAAVNGCHPNYATYLMNKQTITIKSINAILKRIPLAERINFDKELISKLYFEMQAHTVNDADDVAKIWDMLKAKPILLLAPGKSLDTEHELIRAFIEKNSPAVISVNMLNKLFSPQLLFVSNLKRFNCIEDLQELIDADCKMICTSNITTQSKDNQMVINYSDYTIDNDLVSDNAGVIVLKLLIKLGIAEVYLAGFDGFNQDALSNYWDKNLVNNVEAEMFSEKTAAIREVLKSFSNKINLRFITNSSYL